ncbi:MAG: DUF1800 domain-containing protein [Myxococcaceae bacterium]
MLLAACATHAPAPTAAAPAITLPTTALTADQQVQHLLSRAAFGPSAADVARVKQLGVASWLDQQLAPGRDEAVETRLSGFPTLKLTVAQAYRAYPPLQQRAKEAGIDKKADPEEAKVKLAMLAAENPQALPRELLIEATQAKFLRAADSQRQLEEVLVDFWFNHFNVSAEKGQVRWMVTAYERDAIRPHVYGRFRDLLEATATHPAMLFYLDQWLSTKDGFDPRVLRRGDKLPNKGGKLGLNENYARELLELHTLGVDAGYSQDDVREAARALTGWSIEPRQQHDQFGAFVFRPLAHDDGEKHVFGLTLPAGGGKSDGEKLLDYLSRHPKTAHHVALKLCQRFVSDEPPPELVDRVAKKFLDTDGDLRATYAEVFTAPEFWSPAAYRSKVKTPFEFVVSAVRAMGSLESAELPLGRAMDSLGMPLYRCQPPTGYGNDEKKWVNAGGLVARINFGLSLAHGRVRGARVELSGAPMTLDQEVEALGRRLLGEPASAATQQVVKSAVQPDDDRAVSDGEMHPVNRAMVAGLLLGSPEFQKR